MTAKEYLDWRNYATGDRYYQLLWQHESYESAIDDFDDWQLVTDAYARDYGFYHPYDNERHEHYLNLIRTYGARTENSRHVLMAIAKEENRDIIQENNQWWYLDNGISQAESTSSVERKDMSSQHRETYTLTDTDGREKKIRLNGKNKADTDAQFQDICRMGIPMQQKKKPSITFKQFVEETYKPKKVNNLKATTKDTYNYRIDNYMYPVLADMMMDEITLEHVQTVMDRLAHGTQYGYQADMVNGTVDRVMKLLRQIFKIACAMKIVADNPVQIELLTNEGKPSGHHEALSHDEIAHVKKNIPSLKLPRQQMYMALIAYTGMRPEEAIGLTWDRVTLTEKGGFASITSVVTYAGSNKHTVINATGKTENAQRTVILPKACRDILAPYQKASGYVLHGRNANKPMPYSTWGKFTALASFEQLGLADKYSSYDLRSTFCTDLTENGLTNKQAADLMGHADTRMVDTVYAPARKEGIMMQQSFIEQLNAQYAVNMQ